MAGVVFRNVAKKLFSGKYLFVTNTISCGTLLGVGDLSVQTVEFYGNRKKEYDFKRAGRMFAVGLCLGPFNHLWYSYLDKVLPGKTLTTVLKKILADQIVASPFFAFTFFVGAGTLEGQTLSESLDEFRRKFIEVYKADWSFWPAAQAINFFYVKPEYRVVYVSIATLVWNTFLSYMKHRDQHHEEPVKLTAAKARNLPSSDSAIHKIT